MVLRIFANKQQYKVRYASKYDIIDGQKSVRVKGGRRENDGAGGW